MQVVDPIEEQVVDPIEEQVVDSIEEDVIEQVIEQVVEQVIEQVVEPIEEDVIEQVIEQVLDPIEEQVVEQVVDPIEEHVVEETFINSRIVEFEDTRMVDKVVTKEIEVEFEDTRIVTETFTNTKLETITEKIEVEETFINTKVVEFEDTREITTQVKVDPIYKTIEKNVSIEFEDNNKKVLNAGSKESVTYDLEGTTNEATLTLSAYSESKDDGEIILYKDGEEVDRIDIDSFEHNKKNKEVDLEIKSDEEFDRVVIEHGSGSAFHIQGFSTNVNTIENVDEIDLVSMGDVTLIDGEYFKDVVTTETFTNTKEVEFEDTRIVEKEVTKEIEVEFEDTREIVETFTNTRIEEVSEIVKVEETFINTRVEEFEDVRIVDKQDISLENNNQEYILFDNDTTESDNWVDSIDDNDNDTISGDTTDWAMSIEEDNSQEEPIESLDELSGNDTIDTTIDELNSFDIDDNIN